MVNINIDTGLDLLFIKNSTSHKPQDEAPQHLRLVFPERELPVDK